MNSILLNSHLRYPCTCTLAGAVVVALIVLCMAKRHKVINTISQLGEDIRAIGWVRDWGVGGLRGGGCGSGGDIG